jgi:hypothetical protein
VSGDMPTNQRSSQMREFAESKGLMTNARCLTEGVDLPAIDCVVFTDPKKSKVDIVQAAGRALRLSPGKKFGYILIPLIIPENENATEAAKDTAFEEIVATIRALATQDSRIIEYLRAVSSGTIPKGGSPVDGITKINVLTKVNEEEFNKSIQLKVWDRVAFGNWRSYVEAKKYVQSLNLKGQSDWYKYTKSNEFPNDIPKTPWVVYKEFNSLGNFLGTGVIATQNRIFRPFKEAKKYIRSLKFKNATAFLKFTKSKNFPKDLPAAPYNIYKKDWKNFGDFLGTENVSNRYKKFNKYSDLKKKVIKLKLKNQTDWFLYYKNNEFKDKFPRNPQRTYYKEWKGWGDFLGTGNSRKYFLSYNKCKQFIYSLNLKKRLDWQNYIKKNKLPFGIPKVPISVYKKEWKGWPDFLGTSRKPRSKKKS